MSVYYSTLLDTVRFAPVVDVDVKSTRALRAVAALMLDVFVGLKTPVLSAVQVFDSVLLLSLFEGSDDDEDRRAVLELIKDSRIQMRVLPRLVEKRSEPEDTFSLTNAFVSALGREGGFLFSAWPEFNDEDHGPETRRQAIEYMARGRPSLPSILERRLDGIKAMDQAFRDSRATEEAVEAASSLDALIMQSLAPRRGGSYASGVFEKVLAAKPSLEPNKSWNLGLRGDWYKLLDAYSKSADSSEASKLAQIRRVVDLNYNRILAESLRADSLRDEEEDHDLSKVLRDDPDTTSIREQAAFVLKSNARNKWLTFSELRNRVTEQMYPTDSDAARTRRLNELVQDGLGAQLDSAPYMPFVSFAFRQVKDAPTAVGATIGGTVGATAAAIAGPEAGDSVITAGRIFGTLLSTGVGVAVGRTLGNIPPKEWLDSLGLEAKFRDWLIKNQLNKTLPVTAAEIRSGKKKSWVLD
jgi:hypothetical protein